MMSLIQNDELYVYERREDSNIVIYASKKTPGMGHIILTPGQAAKLERALRKYRCGKKLIE